MTKAVALYAIKYSIFNELPWELKGIIIEDLPNNHVEYLLDHFPDLNWDYDKLSELKISIPHLRKNINLWNWEKLSQYMPFDEITDNPTLPWDWSFICLNSTINLAHILMNRYVDWNWMSLAKNKNITLKHLIKLHKTVYVPRYSENPNVTIKEVIDNPNLSWDWYKLSKVIPVSDIIKHNNLRWNWRKVSERDVTVKEYLSNPTLPWHMGLLVQNIKGTIDEIRSAMPVTLKQLEHNKHLNLGEYLQKFTDSYVSEEYYEVPLLYVTAMCNINNTTLSIYNIHLLGWIIDSWKLSQGDINTGPVLSKYIPCKLLTVNVSLKKKIEFFKKLKSLLT